MRPRPVRARALARAALLLALALLAGATSAARAAELTLEGTWYVLIHYRDDTTHDPQQMRWDDRIWVFERKGRDLEWREYPIVVFEDESGRFEKLGGNRAARVVAAWEPSPAQLAQIAGGLEYNTRGAKQKVLKGSDAAGWSSGGGGRSQAANVISYVETWTIEGLPKPVFRRVDSMGSSEDDLAEGVTEYRTESVEQGGALVRGTFERDGTRHGTFRLYKSGEASITKGSGKTQQERMQEAFTSSFGAAFLGDAGLQDELTREAASGKADEATRARVRKSVRDSVERKLRAEGEDPRAAEAYTDQLSRRVEKWLLDDGKSPQEIERLLREGNAAP